MPTPQWRPYAHRCRYEQAHRTEPTPHLWGALSEAEREPWLRQADHALNTITGADRD